ncbi:hypothetical protein F5Y04DRAFT_253420 [Hypomontagnella monticulosa]|nr:hypothetical protein F5Y04DRAFT_253420 [Hypomontagnella monticulosa]
MDEPYWNKLYIRLLMGLTPAEVKQLIDKVEDKNEYVTEKSIEGQTALHIAAHNNGLDISHLLIENATDKSAYIAIQDRWGQTALHIAVSKNNLDLARLLIMNATDKRAYVTIRSNDGRTALHQAAFGGDSRLASLLLEHDADPAIEDSEEHTVWDLASTPGRENWGVISALILQEPNHSYWTRGYGWQVIHANSMGLVNVELGRLGRHHIRRRPANDLDSPRITDQLIEYLKCVLAPIRREFHENQEAPQHLRSREPLCIFQTLDYPEGYAGSKDFISLVMPFISIDQLATLAKREATYTGFVKEPVYCISKAGRFLEKHIPLTLDEYCRPALPQRVLQSRNVDQVVSRYERNREKGYNATKISPGDTDGENVPGLLTGMWILLRAYAGRLRRLMIDSRKRKKHKSQQPTNPPANAVFIHQSWIWKIGDSAIATLPLRIYQDFGLQGGFEHPNKHICIAFVLRYLVELFDKSSSTAPPLLKVYENELSAISEEVNQYMKSVLIEDIDIEQEKAFFHQISDLREELSMIKSVLAEQEEVWREFMGTTWPNQEPGQQQYRNPNKKGSNVNPQQPPSGFRDEAQWMAVWRPQLLFNRYRRRIARLEEDAERVERNISTQLDLKQKHAAMKEAHSMAVVSAMVFGFTIITVVFAPLSFVAALFALPIDRFNEGKDGNQKDGVYSSRYIGKWSATAALASIAVTLLAMWAGLRFVGLHVWGKKGLRAYIKQKAITIRAEEMDRGERGMEERSLDHVIEMEHLGEETAG